MLAVVVLAAAPVAEQPVSPKPLIMTYHADGEFPLKGAFYGGMTVTLKTDSKGTHWTLIPSKPGAQPVISSNAKAVTAFVKGHENATTLPLIDAWAGDIRMFVCRYSDKPCDLFRSATFGEPVVANTPYQLEDGGVRIEWVYEGRVFYISELTMREGLIATARTQPAGPLLLAGTRGEK